LKHALDQSETVPLLKLLLLRIIDDNHGPKCRPLVFVHKPLSSECCQLRPYKVAERGLAPIAIILILIPVSSQDSNDHSSSPLAKRHLQRKGTALDHNTVTRFCIKHSDLAANQAG